MQGRSQVLGSPHKEFKLVRMISGQTTSTGLLGRANDRVHDRLLPREAHVAFPRH
jgi:hypothetical protein